MARRQGLWQARVDLTLNAAEFSMQERARASVHRKSECCGERPLTPRVPDCRIRFYNPHRV